MKAALWSTLFLLATPVALSSHGRDIVSPLLLWSNKAIVGDGLGLQVSYEGEHNVRDLTSDIVLQAAGHEPAGGAGLAKQILPVLSSVTDKQAPVVFVYVGHQLGAGEVRHRNAGVVGLGSITEAAASSMVMPYTHMDAKGYSEKSLQRYLSERLEESSIPHEALGCGLVDGSLEYALRDVLPFAKDGTVRVVLMCSSVAGDVRDDVRLEQEMEEVQALQAVVAGSGLDYLFVLASVPYGRRETPTTHGNTLRARSMAATSVYTTCGPLCQTQVAWLQGMLYVMFGALASCSGMLCLFMLDTPTRFATAKDAGAAQ